MQQRRTTSAIDPIDVIFLGEAEVTFQEFLDCASRDDLAHIDGLAYLDKASW